MATAVKDGNVVQENVVADDLVGAKRIAAEYSTEKTPPKAPAAPVQASAPTTAPSAAPAPPTPPAPQKAAPASFQKGLSVSKVGRR